MDGSAAVNQDTPPPRPPPFITHAKQRNTAPTSICPLQLGGTNGTKQWPACSHTPSPHHNQPSPQTAPAHSSSLSSRDSGTKHAAWGSSRVSTERNDTLVIGVLNTNMYNRLECMIAFHLPPPKQQPITDTTQFGRGPGAVRALLYGIPSYMVPRCCNLGRGLVVDLKGSSEWKCKPGPAAALAAQRRSFVEGLLLLLLHWDCEADSCQQSSL